MAKNVEYKTEIQPGTRVKGQVRGAEDLWVGGRIDGKIDLEGTLVVDTTGVIKADIRAERVVVAGVVVGNVHASHIIEVTSDGRVQGDLRATTIRVDEGARISGALDAGEPGERPVRVASARPTVVVPVEEPPRPATPNLMVVGSPLEERRRKRVVVKKRS